MRLARLLSLFVVLLIVSFFWAQADDGAPGSSEADRAAIAATADAASGCDGDAPGTANPAAVYCGELGYEYEIVDTAEGQYGTCAFPDGSRCDGWRFLEGKCGQGFSYCASQGYDLITKTDGKNPFSIEYSVCVHDGQEIGSVSELMGLGEKATRGSRRVEQAAAPPEERVAAVGQPASFDWRNYSGQDWMTSVKNQASCGGCWAFSAVGTTEAVHNIAASDPTLDLNLSEEYLVSDCYDFVAASCCGGFQSEALKFIRDDGIPDEACLPWVSGTCSCNLWNGEFYVCNPALCTYNTGDLCSNATCSDKCGNWETRLETIASVGRVSIDAGRIKQHVVDKGPLAVALGILQEGDYWDGDIYRCDDDSLPLNHAVVIAGYDDAGGGYWIVKNSWGATWGPDSNGYFKVGYGECGIETDVYYASLVDQTCTSYTSTDVPKAIPDEGTVTSNLNVGDSFTLADVNVGPLNITHPYDDDLDVFLISPASTRVELFTDIGGSGDNFIDTVLDDESIYPIAFNSAPFSWTFRPEGVLADLNGEDSAGQWQLEITDDSGTYQGTLNSWELELCMSDQDGDGVPDEADNCPETYDTGNGDNDGDGIPGTQPPGGATWGGDACDADDDNDTVLDTSDNCPETPNPGQEDFEPDGIGDACDNCPSVPNSDQADMDGDGLVDDDSDTLFNEDQLDDHFHRTDDDGDTLWDEDGGGGDACDTDADGDGYLIWAEEHYGSDPADPGSTPEVCDGVDNDGDTEIDEGYDYNGNTVPDCTDPSADTDGDGQANPDDDDDDNDGLPDSWENFMATDSLDACPDDASDPAWPPDMDNSRRITIGDVLMYRFVIGGQPGRWYYDRRFDLDANMSITIGDVLYYHSWMGQTCT